jgi:transketolase
MTTRINFTQGQPLSRKEVARLEQLAAELRLRIVRMMGANKNHHFGGSLSSADLVTALYFFKMRYNPRDPHDPGRDRFLMSKGHSVPAQYAALAMAGFFPVDELASLKQLGSRLQGHPAAHYTPGLEGCTGSLGQGLSFANGMAMAARIKGLDYRVYCLLGDGELHEGQVWEAAMTTARCRLSNLTAIVDANGFKAMDDASTCCKALAPVGERWAGFGWRVRDIDGHNMAEICSALDWASSQEDGPAVIVAHTVKGKGVSFLENQPGFHNSALNDEQYAKAVEELEANLKTKSEARK